MVAPTKLEVYIKAITRLIKEEKSYHNELLHQLARLEKTEAQAATAGPHDNITYQVKQEKAGIEQTRAMFEPLRLKIAAGVENIMAELEVRRDECTEEQIKAAEEAIEAGKAVMRVAAEDMQRTAM